MFEIGLMKKDEINIQTPQKARIIARDLEPT